MPEIKCPKCGNVFQVDESDYASIARQIRDHEFQDELDRRIKEIEEKKDQDLQIMLIKQQQASKDEISRKDMEIKEAELRLSQLRAQSDARIKELQAKIDAGDTEKKLAVAQAQSKKDEEIAAKDGELIKLQGQLQNKEAEMKLRETSLKESFDREIKQKDEQIEYYKDFKARQSTKMVGESLEQHCLNEFNKLRMTAFPNAYFEKDNDARTGSKGDFIFREASDDGTEFISIMFEMKNEMDTTASKHKNEDFFKELDKDRKEKGCEYAILVSLLEADNEYYNNGIVDVSYRYEKMYVIRPQFFIPIITLLRNAALNSLRYQRELSIVRNQQLDITNFENNMNAFKEAFGRNYRLASERFQKAIEEIDKTIDHLNKTKADLLASDNNLRLANNKADDLSIKKLTRNAPSVRAMFDEAAKENDSDL
ncbi:MAG: DUF2130 domain-containing protein [Clostridiales bacterium]|nr:DUF2130 domain-containing protein [Clostridiales bacterium]